jgi:multicomponent Na+:H+ antiporter subunit C
MILTAIVIAMGIAAFVLALTYRSYRLNTAEEVTADPEDTRVSELAGKDGTPLEDDRPEPDIRRDTDAPDELDALPGHEGSR